MNRILFSTILFSTLLLFSCGNSSEIKEEKTVSVDAEKELEKTDNASVLSTLEPQKNIQEKAGVEAKTSAKKTEENHNKNIKIDIEIFNNDTITQEPKYSGYGYNIIIDNGAAKIHQPHKPAVPGIKGFKSEKDAKKAAQLVVYKIRNNIMPPVVTSKELDSLGVLK